MTLFLSIVRSPWGLRSYNRNHASRFRKVHPLVFLPLGEDDLRHLEVRLGNVETSDETGHVSATVAKTGTVIEVLIRRSLNEVGRAIPDGGGLSSLTLRATAVRKISLFIGCDGSDWPVLTRTQGAGEASG